MIIAVLIAFGLLMHDPHEAPTEVRPLITWSPVQWRVCSAVSEDQTQVYVWGCK
jgi:hypothetical protein